MPNHSRENKLIPVRCDGVAGEKPSLVLMGLIKSAKTEKGTEGWLLLVSGNPLVPHSKEWRYANKIGIHNVYLNDDQKQMLYQSSTDKNGYVYLYTCNFILGDCQVSTKCQQRHSDPLPYLAEYLNKKPVVFDLECIVPLKVAHLRNIVVKKGSEQATGCHDQPNFLPLEIFEDEVNFKFRTAGKNVFVDLECPGNHPEYHVELLFLETLIFKNSDGHHTITNILEQDELYVSPSFSGKTFPVTMTLRMFQLPENQFNANNMHPVEGNASGVEFWVKAYLNKLDNSHPQKAQDNFGGAIEEKELTKARETVETSPSLWKKYMNFWKPTILEECEKCTLSTRLVVMEVELDALEEETEDE